MIRDDHAAIKQIKTAAELSEALGTIAAAVLHEEITSTEANEALALLGQLLRTVRSGQRCLAERESFESGGSVQRKERMVAP